MHNAMQLPLQVAMSTNLNPHSDSFVSTVYVVSTKKKTAVRPVTRDVLTPCEACYIKDSRRYKLVVT